MLTKEEAINRSCTGPIARASGVESATSAATSRICRTPILISTSAAPAKATAWRGTRSAWRKCTESLKILHQAVENIPPGAGQRRADRRSILPPPGKVWTTIEGLITHFELVMPNRGMPVPNEEVYAATEAPNGELGFYVVGDGSPRAYSCPLPAAFVHPFCRLSALDPRPYPQRRRGRVGQL